MKRQYDYTVGPPSHGQVPIGRNWENKHIFERWGDDNSVYFTNDDQLLMSNGLLGHGGADWNENQKSTRSEVILSVPAGHTATTFLCEESRNVKRIIRLQGPGAQAKIFVDAWEHFQTVPLIVQAAGVGSVVAYQWSFHNYIPISSPGPGGAPLSGKGVASYFPNVNLSPPIVQTLGSTDRTPMGEHPVSEATKQKTCACAEERPYFLISHQGSETNGPLIVVIKVAQ